MSIMIANNVAFLHTHVLSDGQIVQHAHPFSKNKAENQNPAHTHNTIEILILNQLLIFGLFISATGLLISIFSTQINYVAQVFHVCIETRAISTLRGPPQFINA
jgi:hypothetical protein